MKPKKPDREKLSRQSSFNVLTWFRWDESLIVRQVAYEVMFKLAPVKPDTALSFACSVLELFRGEPDENTRLSLLEYLEVVLRLRKKKLNVPSFSSFHERLILTIENEKQAVHALALIDLGLDIASLDQGPASQNFFDYFIGHLALHRRELPAKCLLLTLDKIESLVCNQPRLVNSEYIDLCRELLETPLLIHRRSRYGVLQPHEQHQTKKIDAENEAIQRVYAKVGRQMIAVLGGIGNGAIAFSINELFTNETMIKLNFWASGNAPNFHVGGIAREIIMIIEDFNSRTNPPLPDYRPGAPKAP